MSKLVPNSYKDEFKSFNLPEKCGVQGCNNPCDVYVFTKKVSRCTKHYCQDFSDHKNGGVPNVLGRFHAEKDILEKLKEVGMEQTPDESMKEYAERCKKHLQTMGNGFSELLNRKSSLNVEREV